MTTLNSIDMLARLVAFPTVSRDSNLPLIDWVEEYLEQFGARCRRTWNAEKTKANLLAAIGPGAPGGVLLSAHTAVRADRSRRFALRPRHLRHEGFCSRGSFAPHVPGYGVDG